MIYYFYYMRSNRSETYSNNKSRFSQNFQLVKPKAYTTRPNPEQLNIQLFNQSRRYDIVPLPGAQIKNREKTQSYRVRRSFNKSSPRSENGRTVYEIRNVKNTSAQLNVQGQSQVTSESDPLITHMNNRGLQLNKKLTEPKSQSSKQYSYSYLPFELTPRKSLAVYLQKQWNMNQALENQEKNMTSGSIIKQQIPKKQNPLNPSNPESLSQILQNYCYRSGASPYLEKIPEQQQEDTNIVSSGIAEARGDVVYDQALVDRLNSRTKYYRFRHQQKIKQRVSKNMNQHNNLYVSKEANKMKVDSVEISYGWPIQQIIKLIHHSNNNRLKITIKVPKQFHHTPDSLLPDDELKFKAVMMFEQLGIISPGLVCLYQQIQVLKHFESTTFIFENQKQQTLIHQFDQGEVTAKEIKYCISWYTDGSVYLGQIRRDVRHGIGLEWVPGVYVYYGQYAQNFRHGYGVMKYNNMQTYLGVWAYDSYHGYGKLLDKQGLVLEQGVYRNSQMIRQGQYNELA